MTELRDARLQRALHAAPDADALPSRSVREAIRAAAHDAVRPWWQRWLPAGRSARWAPAFATVLLAGLVTLLWQGQEIPDARPGADAQSPAVAPAASAPSAEPSPVMPEATKAAPDAVRKEAAPHQPAPARPAPPQKAEAAKALEARVDPPAAPAPASAPPTAMAPAPPPALAEAAPPAAAAPAPATAAVPPPAPAAAPPTAAAAPTAPAAEARARNSFRGLAAPREMGDTAEAQPWTQVRVESDGASVVVPRAQAGTLPALMARMLRAETMPAVAGAPQLRLEFAQDGEPAGVLESVAGQWRWQPMGDAAPARGLRPSPALDAQLRAEAERLLRN